MSKLKNDIKQEREQIKRKLRAISPARLVVLLVMIAVTVCSYVFYGYFFGDKSGWCTAPNTGSDFVNDVLKLVPVVVKCIQSLTILYFIATVLTVILHKSFRKTQRGVTVSNLLCNLINWLTAIIAVIIVLACFGVDTTAIITGAGVLTLIVGLGMQSLIADIVAGLFIVFENAFNVGDIITVGDFRGEVISIGIRTTQLRALGNIKIFNNSDLRGILNHDREPSVAKTLIDVEYGDKLPQIEEVIKQNVGKLVIEGALDKVSYDGVAQLGASGVTLQFTVPCKESDIFAVNRALNAAVKNMFDENGIGIPFPQIVVHQD